MQELLDLIQRNLNRRQLEKAGALVLFHINFCKISRYLFIYFLVSLLTQTTFGDFGHFDKIFRSSKGHLC